MPTENAKNRPYHYNFTPSRREPAKNNTSRNSDIMDLPAHGTHGLAMKYLDFLVYDEMRAIIPHGDGIIVNVPRPERFAVHKLLVSEARKQQRNQNENFVMKKSKDVLQAQSLVVCLGEHDPDSLVRAWDEANSRGPAWRKLLGKAFEKLPDNIQKLLKPHSQEPPG